MLEFLGVIALISIIFGISMGDALGGLVQGIIWTVAICAALCFIGGLYQDIKNGVFRESEEQKKKRLAQEEAQKKAKKMELGDWKAGLIVGGVLITAMVVSFIIAMASLN